MLQLKGKNTYETIENVSILFIIIGAILLSTGLGLSVVMSKGLSAILALTGAFLTFFSVVILIFSWLVKELKGD